jgi:hypothetical protein
MLAVLFLFAHQFTVRFFLMLGHVAFVVFLMAFAVLVVFLRTGAFFLVLALVVLLPAVFIVVLNVVLFMFTFLFLLIELM